MTTRRWILAHKSLVSTVTSGALIAALLATVAVVSSGYSAQRLDLGDASVWVANSAERSIGRANTEVFELNSLVEGSGDDVEVVQDGATVLLLDRSDATLGIVAAATSVVLDSVALPPDAPEVFLAGTNAVVHSAGTGGLWIVPLVDLPDFDADAEPNLSLGAHSAVSVDDNGLLFAFSPESKVVYRVEASSSTTVDASIGTTLGGAALDGGAGPDDGFAITSAGGRWALLDRAGSRLELPGRVVELDDVDSPVLQRASAAGAAVLVGHSAGILAVSPASGRVDPLFAGASGVAVTPVALGGCSFGAWSDGQAWRRCASGDGDATLFALDSVPATTALEFQTNQTRLVLNDSRGGASWAVQSAGELIDNWDELVSDDENRERVEENEQTTPPEVEEEQLPPVAVDDDLGARAGRASALPVLINDYDPNGDVIVIGEVTAIDPAVGRVDVIDGRQRVQLTLAPTASGSVAFGYTVDDGRGGTASATVTVTVRSSEENSPPQQVRVTRLEVAAGGQASASVLGDWIDPDGDPFYLERAAAAAPARVVYTPEGAVTVSNDTAVVGGSTVTLLVSDGRAQGSGGLTLTFRAADDVELVADPFVVFAHAGEETTVSPLEHVRGGGGGIRLNAVPPKAGVTITPSYEAGTFRVVSDLVRSHYLEYVVTDGDRTVTGLVRFDVSAPPDPNTQPVATPKTVFVPTLSSRTVDVAASDEDPAGGVLLVTGVSAPPQESGVRAEVLEQRAVRVTLTGPLAAAVTFEYRITNGLAAAQGTITVVEIAPPDRVQPPIARDDTATVRVGDAITIDVLGNDDQPDGEPITLNPVLVDGLGGSAGLLFASGDTLRYLAPTTTGNFTAVYEIVGPLGQTAQAQLSIEVREPSPEANSAPVPTTVVARVLAGERVRIDIPLSGIDPDGDSVQLLGQESGPNRGGVVAVGADYLDYEAGAYSAGTDTFTYSVMDALGARATGTVRVGISPPLEGARNPVAVEDTVEVRPGATVSVRVLENDSDPDGSALGITSAVPNDENLDVVVAGDSILSITAPPSAGRYGLVYTIENESGGSSSNFVTVIVRADAPRAYPEAADTVLTLSDVLDRSSVDVDVLANVFFADGRARELDLSLVPGYEGSARVTADKRIRVTIRDAGQIIPFAVAHPDEAAVRSYAFVWVPGFSDALPQLNRNAPRLQTDSGEAVTIDLNDYVLAIGGRRVQLTDSSTVRATHSDGSSLVVDSSTLRFRSADLYFGPASISFEVTDGASPSDPVGRRANLVLPITVDPRDNQPPAFTGASIDFEPSQEKVIDLTDLTDYPYAEDVDELVYSVQGGAPTGFSYSLSGQRLSIRANADAATGSTTAITLGVRDALAAGSSGRIRLAVVPSTRPLAIPAADSAVVRRGQSTTVDVLANDEATNPFPGRPLRVLAVRGLDGGSLPAGMSVSASADNRTLTVGVAASAATVDATLQYQLADATRDPGRTVWGSVRVSVQDVPDPPARAVRQGSGFEPGELRLRITPPQPNNSPIIRYTVVSANQGGYRHDCGTALICPLPGLVAGAEYRFQVIATNAVGDSAAGAASDAYSVDFLPEAPQVSVAPSPADQAPTGGSLTVRWAGVPDPSPGSAITGYTVEVAGRDPLRVGRSATSATIDGLPSDTEVAVAVYARNSAKVASDAEWRRSSPVSARTVGPPTAGTVTAASALDGSIVVAWTGFGANGGALSYDVSRYPESQGVPTACSPGDAALTSPWTDATAVPGTRYTYVVSASNGLYCTTVSTEVRSTAPPGPASATVTVESRGTGQFDLRAVNPEASGIVDRFQYRLGTGDWQDVPDNGWLTSAANGVYYGVATDVRFRACADPGTGFCGAESSAVSAIPLSVRAGVTVCIAGLPPVAVAPPNIALLDVVFAFSYVTPAFPEGTGYSSDPVPSDATAVRVRATVTVGGVDFTDSGYGESACN